MAQQCKHDKHLWKSIVTSNIRYIFYSSYFSNIYKTNKKYYYPILYISIGNLFSTLDIQTDDVT